MLDHDTMLTRIAALRAADPKLTHISASYEVSRAESAAIKAAKNAVIHNAKADVESAKEVLRKAEIEASREDTSDAVHSVACYNAEAAVREVARTVAVVKKIEDAKAEAFFNLLGAILLFVCAPFIFLVLLSVGGAAIALILSLSFPAIVIILLLLILFR